MPLQSPSSSLSSPPPSPSSTTNQPRPLHLTGRRLRTSSSDSESNHTNHHNNNTTTATVVTTTTTTTMNNGSTNTTCNSSTSSNGSSSTSTTNCQPHRTRFNSKDFITTTSNHHQQQQAAHGQQQQHEQYTIAPEENTYVPLECLRNQKLLSVSFTIFLTTYIAFVLLIQFMVSIWFLESTTESFPPQDRTSSTTTTTNTMNTTALWSFLSLSNPVAWQSKLTTWTITNAIHLLLTIVYIHWLKGSFLLVDEQGELNGMTVWEQLEATASVTTTSTAATSSNANSRSTASFLHSTTTNSSYNNNNNNNKLLYPTDHNNNNNNSWALAVRRTLFTVPTVLAYTACVSCQFDSFTCTMNILLWSIAIMAKLPFMNGVRIFGINRTAGIDDE